MLFYGKKDQVVKSSPLSLVLETLPLLLFFIVYSMGSHFGITEDDKLFAATFVLCLATVLGCIIQMLVYRSMRWITIIGSVLIVFFSCITLLFHDKRWIMIRPTVMNALLGCLLLWSHLAKKNVMKVLLGQYIPISDRGWSTLTRRWIVYFFSVAFVNEAVRNFCSEYTWVQFKFFVLLPAMFLFALLQIPLMLREHQLLNPPND